MPLLEQIINILEKSGLNYGICRLTMIDLNKHVLIRLFVIVLKILLHVRSW